MIKPPLRIKFGYLDDWEKYPKKELVDWRSDPENGVKPGPTPEDIIAINKEKEQSEKRYEKHSERKWDARSGELEVPAKKLFDEIIDDSIRKELYRHIYEWKEKLERQYVDKKRNKANKHALGRLISNPYKWLQSKLREERISLNRELQRGPTRNRIREINQRLEKNEEELENLKTAFDNRIPLAIERESTEEYLKLDRGDIFMVAEHKDALNAHFHKDTDYTIKGLIQRGPNRFIVLKTTEGETVELPTKIGDKMLASRANPLASTAVPTVAASAVGTIVPMPVRGAPVPAVATGPARVVPLKIEPPAPGIPKPTQEEVFSPEDLDRIRRFNAETEKIGQVMEMGKRKKTTKEQVDMWMDLSQDYGWGVTSITPTREVDDTEAMEKAKQEKIKQEKAIKEVGVIFREGIDKVVVHGDTIENDDGDLDMKSSPDLDMRGALYFLNNIAGIKYRTGKKDGHYPQTQFVPKGEKATPDSDKGLNVLYVDVGGEMLSVDKTDGGARVFIDHHQSHYDVNRTSATKLMYEVLLKNKLIEKEPWMDNFIRFITDYDNLLYVQSEKYNEHFLRNNWSKSLFGVCEEMPIEMIVQFFKDGRDPFKPEFSDEEKENITIDGEPSKGPDGKLVYEKNEEGDDVVVREKKSLGDIIKAKQAEIFYEIMDAFPFAVQKMKDNGIQEQTRALGRVLFNTLDPQIGPNGKKRVNMLKHGFLIAKAFGYDAYVVYNENKKNPKKGKRYFVNAVDFNMAPIANVLKEIDQGTANIRDVMLFPSKKSKDRKGLTRNLFFEAADLKIAA